MSDLPLKNSAFNLITINELADELEVCTKTIRTWDALGEGPPVTRLGRRLVRYRREDVERWLAGRSELANG